VNVTAVVQVMFTARSRGGTGYVVGPPQLALIVLGMDPRASAESLHRIRGRIDLALDLIGRCVVAHRPEGTEASERILVGLCQARSELAAVAETIDGQLLERLSVGA